MSEINQVLRKKKANKERGPVWKGPEEDGITFSLLSRFLVCRERFRILVMEGLKPTERFNHRTGYGDMWHVCEEVYASGGDRDLWPAYLKTHAQELCRKHPTDQTEIDKWYRVCKAQFPIYVKHWQNHPDTEKRTPLLSEEKFSVPLLLPSGRMVRLRGKWDSVDMVKDGKKQEIWLQENKTKGDVYVPKIERQLTFDLQTMLYLVALVSQREDYPSTMTEHFEGAPIVGVRYNVVRRPLSGGKGTIVQHQATQGAKCPRCKGTGTDKDGLGCGKCEGKGRIGAKPGESMDEYMARLSGIIEGSPEEFFWRWKSRVSPTEIEKFKRECLYPILEELCNWWNWMNDSEGWRFGCHHWRHPFGVYNSLDEGGSTDLDEYLATGSEVGLSRVDNLFPEL